MRKAVGGAIMATVMKKSAPPFFPFLSSFSSGIHDDRYVPRSEEKGWFQEHGILLYRRVTQLGFLISFARQQCHIITTMAVGYRIQFFKLDTEGLMLPLYRMAARAGSDPPPRWGFVDPLENRATDSHQFAIILSPNSFVVNARAEKGKKWAAASYTPIIIKSIKTLNDRIAK